MNYFFQIFLRALLSNLISILVLILFCGLTLNIALTLNVLTGPGIFPVVLLAERSIRKAFKLSKGWEAL